MGGLSVADEDIIAFDGGGFSRLFDGSDVGVSGFRLDAFAVLGPGEVLMSFTTAGSIPGLSGTVDDSDVVKFTGTLGPITAGAFELYFDGSDVGLTKNGEDVDSIELLSDGRLLVSTTGSFSVPGAFGSDEDIVAFTPVSLGSTTSGAWAVYFDGSDVGLTRSGEDVDGVAVADDATGSIYLSTVGRFSVSGLTGADEDVFVFTPSSTGSATSGSYASSLFFDGSLYGLRGNDLFAIDLP